MSTRHKLLIVDDDDANIRVLKRIFKQELDIESARNGEEALEIISSFRPDLILLDIVMPGMDGYETCKRIRADARFRLTKIILVSGRGLVEERLKGYESGADDYITKPFNNEELKAKVRVFLRLKRSEEVDLIKGDLLTLFSHETKTPLSGIIGLSEMLKEDPKLDANTRECAELIYQSGRQLLDFVRKTSLLCELKGSPKLRMSSEVPKNHIENKVVAAKKDAEERDIKIEVDCKDHIEIDGDWGKLDLVIEYLLDNAVKYSPDGGVVRIRGEQSDSSYNVWVENEGEGIAPEWIDKIFDEFAIQDVMHHQKGQGLSLSISKHIVDLHSGAIEVQSAKGQGAKFTIRLPV